MKRILLHRMAVPMAALVVVMATLFVAPTHAFRPAPTDFIWISAGDYHTCASRFDGTTFCWGANDKGQLGNGGASVWCPNAPNNGGGSPPGKWCADTVQQVKNFAFGQVDAGGDTTCGIAPGGGAFCWGDNQYGQVGTNFMGLTSYSTPRQVMDSNHGFIGFTRISSGSTTTCGLSATSGTLGMFCWGLAVTGNTSTFTPTLEVSSAALTDVSVGNGHVCTTAANALANEIDCSGMDNYGQLGVSPKSLGTVSGVPFSTPLSQQVFSSLGNYASRVSAGGGPFGFGGGHAYTCADEASGTVWCVGNNENGQLGLGSASFGANYLTLGAVGHGQPLVGVTTGMSHACAVDPYTSYVWCWGQDDNGELGNKNFGGVWAPQQVTGDYGALVTFRSVAAGMSHTCGIGTDNHIYCWGDNSAGQLALPRGSYNNVAHAKLVF